MSKIYCDNCEEKREVSRVSGGIPFCSFCNELIIQKNKTKLSDLKIIGIELIYQKNTFQKIIVSTEKTILGRESVGKEILDNILVNGIKANVISREHCLIEYNQNINKFLIQDLNSTNGTFVNDNECKDKISIEDNSFVKLGMELFIAKYIYGSDETINDKKEIIKGDSNKIAENTTIEEKEMKLLFYCSQCSKKFKENGYCPDCDVNLKKV